MKKTPFQLHKEREEEKRKREQEAAALVFDDFVESFKADDDKDRSGLVNFVRGGQITPGQKEASSIDKGKKSSKYIPSFLPPPSAATASHVKPHPSSSLATKTLTSSIKAFQDDDDEVEEEENASVFQPAKKQDKDKPRAIDTVLEKLRADPPSDHSKPSSSTAPGHIPSTSMPSSSALDDGYYGGPKGLGSHDDGDPNTTNLYLGNIAPDVDEALLMREFGRYGPLASVKIMWPRTEEQKAALRNCGFVSFMRRHDAERAMQALNGMILRDYEMKIGWGKAIPIPPLPIYPPAGNMALVSNLPTQMTRVRTRPEPPPGIIAAPGGYSAANTAGTPLPLDATIARSHAGGGGAAAVAAALGYGRMHMIGGGGGVVGVGMMNEEEDPEALIHRGQGPDIEVKFPSDLKQRYIIDSLALFVNRDGCDFEQVVMELEAGNPEYSFLFNLSSPEHVYYRWRVYSLAEGDSMTKWREEPFVMVSGGQRWLPPPRVSSSSFKFPAGLGGSLLPATGVGRDGMASGGSGVGEGVAGRGAYDRPLSEMERDKFEDILRKLTVERESICEAMAFALDHADAHSDIVEILQDALTLPETPVPVKVARLFVVNDILHNATAPVRGASRYRGKLEASLPYVFESLHEASRSLESRMAQEALRRNVLRVLKAWRTRFVFSDDFLNGLQATFLQPLISPPPIGPLSLNEEPQKASEVKEEEFGRVGLRTELEALSLDDLERRCRINGLVSKGKPSALIHRLLALDLYLMPLERQPQSQAVAPAHDTAKAPEGEADLVTALKSSDGESELRTNLVKDGAGLKSDAAVGGVGSSKSRVSSWTVVEEEKEENREKTADMFKVSQWIREEQEAMERERKKLEDVVGDDSGDIFDGLSKGKRVREEQEVAETEVKRMKQ